MYDAKALTIKVDKGYITIATTRKLPTHLQGATLLITYEN